MKIISRVLMTLLLVTILVACGDAPATSTVATPPTATIAPATATSAVRPTATTVAATAMVAVSGTATPVAAADGCVTSYDANTDYFPNKVEIKYAKRFKVRYEKNYKVITADILGDSGGDTVATETYVLVQCGTPAPELSNDLAGAFTFQIPLKRYFEGAGGTFGAIEALGVADSMAGAYGTYSGIEYSPAVAARLARDDVPKVNYYDNLEPLVDLKLDAFSGYNGVEFDNKARALGIPVIYHYPFTENPLGSAEQVKFLALFFNREARANEFFAPVEAEYLRLRDLAAAQPTRPNVLLGQVTNGIFDVRNDKQIESILIRDGGGTDILAALPEVANGQSYGSVSLETAVEYGADADYWFSLVYTPKEQTAPEFIATEPLNARFAAMVKGNTFHRFARGEDYFATAAVRPDELLADMISILHPDLLPDHVPKHLKRIAAQ